MGECCKMFSGVLGKIKNFGWGLLNQTGRAPALPGGSSRDAIRRRHPGTARAARGRGSPGPLPGQRRRPRLCHQLLTGMARGVRAIAQMMMVTMLCAPWLSAVTSRHMQIIVEQPERVNKFLASFCAGVQAASAR